MASPEGRIFGRPGNRQALNRAYQLVQSTRFEFVVNLMTAKALGLEFHPQFLASVDDVIE